jgi:hypothetical protein
MTTTVATLFLLTAVCAEQAQGQSRVAAGVTDQAGAVLPDLVIDLVVNEIELTVTTDVDVIGFEGR